MIAQPLEPDAVATPRVSVVIPTFNRLRYLRQALDSVAAQTMTDFETIVVDDGSSEDIATSISDHPTHPRVIRMTQRGGPAAARNRGVSEARGEWVAFLDSDDIWLPEKLERYLQHADRQPRIHLWYGPMRPVRDDLSAVAGHDKPCHAGRLHNELFQASFVHVPTVLCRRETLLEYGPFDATLRVCEDYDLWLRMSRKFEFGLVEAPMALRRLHDDRLSKSCMRRNLATKLDVLERAYKTSHGTPGFNDRAARIRVARIAFAAGRAAWREAYFDAAVAMFRKARHYGVNLLRVLPMQVTAALLHGVTRREDDAGNVTAGASSRV